jgi:hypothetical protein
MSNQDTSNDPIHLPWSRRIVEAAPDLVMTSAYLVTWAAPYTLGERMVRHLMLVMLIEFFVVHSAGFLGELRFGKDPLRKKRRTVIGLAAFYAIFMIGIGASMGAWWPVLGFGLLMINRCGAALFDRQVSEAHQQYTRAGWAAGILFYLLAVPVVAIESLPAWGIDAQVIAAQGFGDTSGEWVERPETALAAGAIYFTLHAMRKLIGRGWFIPRKKKLSHH